MLDTFVYFSPSYSADLFLSDPVIVRFTEFGGPIHQRPVQDLAFAVARFIQKGGSYVNYYMVGHLWIIYHISKNNFTYFDKVLFLLFVATKHVVPCFEVKFSLLWLLIIDSIMEELISDVPLGVRSLLQAMITMLQSMNMVRKLCLFVMTRFFDYFVVLHDSPIIWMDYEVMYHNWNISALPYLAYMNDLGLIRQPKYSHLKDLHKVIKRCEHALVSSDPTVTSLGTYQQVNCHIYEETNPSSSYVLVYDKLILWWQSRYSLYVLGDFPGSCILCRNCRMCSFSRKLSCTICCYRSFQ